MALLRQKIQIRNCLETQLMTGAKIRYHQILWFWLVFCYFVGKHFNHFLDFGLNRRTLLTAEIVSFDITKSQKACRAAWLLLWNVVRYWEQVCKCLRCKFFRQHLMGLQFWLILIDFGRASPGIHFQRDLFSTSLLPSNGVHMKLVFPSSRCRQQR